MSWPRRVAAPTLAAICAVVLLAPAAGAAGTTAGEGILTVVSTDVTAYPDVRLVVAAPASLDGQVLTSSAFQVLEGGQARPVTVEALPPEQLEVALVIDTSASMIGTPLLAAKSAARSFLSRLPDSVPVSVIAFGGAPRLLSTRSTNRILQGSVISSLSASGETALYDALAAALGQLPATSGARRAIVVLGDGADSTSALTLEATLGALATAGVPVFAVELATAESNPAALSRITSASGGRTVSVSDPQALAGAFDAIGRQLAHQYTVRYRSEARGATDIDVVLQADAVSAGAKVHLELPSVPAAASPVPGTAPVRDKSNAKGWTLVLGAALCGAAMLALGIGVFGSSTPKARGLAVRRRQIGLAGATDRAEALSDSVMRRGGGAVGVSKALESAGVDIRAGELLLAAAGAAVLALMAGWVLVSPLIGLVLALAVPLVARAGLDVLSRRRRSRFSNQLAETLQILAGSLRAGHGLAQGIDTVAREAESPTAEEFRRLTIETRLDRDLVDALSALSDRVGSEDFRWVVQAIEIQREVGGDLAEVLDSVAGTMRDRTKIRRQISALSAEGRMSAWVLMVLPFGLAGVMGVTNPKYLSPLFESGTGQGLIVVGAVLLVVGGLWLRRIVKPIF